MSGRPARRSDRRPGFFTANFSAPTADEALAWPLTDCGLPGPVTLTVVTAE
jgi:hypothetical protein